MMEYFHKAVKRMDLWDIILTKWAVVFFMMFIFTIWSTFREWVLSINPWVWFVIFVIMAIRPMMKVFAK